MLGIIALSLPHDTEGARFRTYADMEAAKEPVLAALAFPSLRSGLNLAGAASNMTPARCRPQRRSGSASPRTALWALQYPGKCEVKPSEHRLLFTNLGVRLAVAAVDALLLFLDVRFVSAFTFGRSLG